VGLGKHPAKQQGGVPEVPGTATCWQSTGCCGPAGRGAGGAARLWRGSGGHAHREGPTEPMRTRDGPTHHARGTRWDASTLGSCQQMTRSYFIIWKGYGFPHVSVRMENNDTKSSCFDIKPLKKTNASTAMLTLWY